MDMLRAPLGQPVLVGLECCNTEGKQKFSDLGKNKLYPQSSPISAEITRDVFPLKVQTSVKYGAVFLGSKDPGAVVPT